MTEEKNKLAQTLNKHTNIQTKKSRIKAEEKQYCAKVMQTTFDDFRALFESPRNESRRKFDEISLMKTKFRTSKNSRKWNFAVSSRISNQ